MTKFVELISTERNQILAFLGISFAIAILTGILYFRNAVLFQAFFGKLNPFLVILALILLGTILSVFLLSRGWFSIYKAGEFKGILVAAGLAALPGLVIILIDLKAVFPADTNRPFPDSLFFYPIFGYVVEVVFHMLPLALFLFILTSIFNLKFRKSDIALYSGYRIVRTHLSNCPGFFTTLSHLGDNRCLCKYLFDQYIPVADFQAL